MYTSGCLWVGFIKILKKAFVKQKQKLPMSYTVIAVCVNKKKSS